MSNRMEVLTPVGRLVLGSLYEGQTTDIENRPLTIKTGANAGQPRTNYYFAVAIPKGSEQHWSQTEWGKVIWDVGHVGFPNGQTQNPSFAWKIKDGDSTVPNKAGRRPCDIEGHPGHWILNFSSAYPPSIYTECGKKQFLEKDAVKLGDYVEVFGSVSDNGSNQQPGVFLNHSMVNFVGYGDRIFTGPDPKAVGFSGQLPPGASKTPIQSGFNPHQAAPVNAGYSPPPVQNVVQPPAYPQILMPPVPGVAPVRQMTEKAQGLPYEQYISNGWTDALLIQHGYMNP